VDVSAYRSAFIFMLTDVQVDAEIIILGKFVGFTGML
jgi:hypothetical protein